MFDMTRNQFFLIGLILLFLGAEFRLIERVELTPECTQFLFKQSSPPMAAAAGGVQSALGFSSPVIKKTVPIPDSVGWGLLCLGGVFVLHSLMMRGPNG